MMRKLAVRHTFLAVMFLSSTAMSAEGPVHGKEPSLSIVQYNAVPQTGQPEANTYEIDIPKTEKRFSGTPGVVSINPSYETVPVNPALAFKNLRFKDALCFAVLQMLNEKMDFDGCKMADGTIHKDSGVRLKIISIDGDNKSGEFELFGNSANLALKHPGWVERHRFFAALSLVDLSKVKLLVVDHQPMYRTTSELEPDEDELLQMIEISRQEQLRIFQDIVSQRLRESVQMELPGRLFQ
jgi:hypothetical protein